MSKKWLNATFLSFTGFASRIRSRAAKSAKYENLWVFIRSDAHVVRAGLNIRGCGPLSTLGFIDRLRAAKAAHFLFVYLFGKAHDEIHQHIGYLIQAPCGYPFPHAVVVVAAGGQVGAGQPFP